MNLKQDKSLAYLQNVHTQHTSGNCREKNYKYREKNDTLFVGEQ